MLPTAVKIFKKLQRFSTDSPMRIAFGDCILDTGSRELLRNGVPVHLPPKAFHLLLILLAERPQALAKDDLMERLWPGTFVTEANLSNLVADLRRAIGDDPRRPRFIRTVHGFGYTWRGAAEMLPDLPAAPADHVYRLEWMGREVPLDPGANVLGRVQDAIVWIVDPAVSRRHAQIVVDGRGATLEDLGSKNGTRLKGIRITGAVSIEDGDEIELGGTKMIFRVRPVGSDVVTTVAARLSKD